MREKTCGAQFAYWLKLARLPFYLAGFLPFLLGSLIAARFGYFNMHIFSLAGAAVLLIMLSTNLNGEAYDIREDAFSQKLGKNKFTGGSGILVQGLVPVNQVKFVSLISAGLALSIGVVLQFVFHTGPATLILGASGLIAGFFYSKPPLRWVNRGFGEVLIGYCYGWLPVAVAFYLQANYVHTLIHWVSIPVALTIFNVILINEFPDRAADTAAGKKNILFRIGDRRARRLYGAGVIGLGVMFYNSVIMGVPIAALFYFAPFFIVALINMHTVLHGDISRSKTLERVCGLTILVNIGTLLAYLVSFL